MAEEEDEVRAQDGLRRAHGEAATELVRGLKRNAWLPPYDSANMREVVQEIAKTTQLIHETLQDHNYEVDEPAVACGLLVHHESLMRDKRCALAYLNERMRRIVRAWWEVGTVIPDEFRANLSPQEKAYFEGYDQLVSNYMNDMDVLLTSDQVPPKELFVEVRALQDVGEVMTESGVVNLKRNTAHLVRRSDAELLVRQGLVKLTE